MEKMKGSLKDCGHCEHNPNAAKPFIEMKKLPLKNWNQIVRVAEADGKNPNCYVCELVESVIDSLNQKSKD